MISCSCSLRTKPTRVKLDRPRSLIGPPAPPPPIDFYSPLRYWSLCIERVYVCVCVCVYECVCVSKCFVHFFLPWKSPPTNPIFSFFLSLFLTPIECVCVCPSVRAPLKEKKKKSVCMCVCNVARKRLACLQCYKVLPLIFMRDKQNCEKNCEKKK